MGFSNERSDYDPAADVDRGSPKGDSSSLDMIPPGDSRWDLICRISNSRYFAKSPKLQRFLQYIGARSLTGRLDEAREQLIGVHVFGRPADYNPGEDNIVRSYARTLRKRLEEYFATEGRSEALVVEVPRGGYVTLFRARDNGAGKVTPAAAKSAGIEGTKSAGAATLPDLGSKTTAPLTTRFPAPWLQAGAVLLLAAMAFGLGRASTRGHSSPMLGRFWGEFGSNSGVLWVPSDTGLTMILGLTKRSVTVPEYLSGEYLNPMGAETVIPDEWAHLGVHRYTDLMDVLLLREFLRLAELSGLNTTVRYARDLRPDELKHGNTVLIGGVNGNPWVQLFDQNLNFQLAFVPERRTFEIRNRHPQKGELAVYPYERRGSAQGGSYGLVALQRNLTGSGWVLVIEGVSASGLQVGADYVLRENSVQWILAHATNSNGHLRPFELLLKTNNVASNATNAEVLGFRVY